MVEEDIEEELKAAQKEEEGYGSDEEKPEEKKQEEKKVTKSRKPKDAFFDGSDSEDAPTQSAYSKPSRGGGQQVNRGGRGRGGRGGKTSLALDEDNFPTL